MKAPKRPVLRLRRPVPQTMQARGSLPSALAGKMCGPRLSLSASRTLVVRSSETSPTLAWNSVQNSRSSAFQSSSPALTRSSFSSRAAVKSYST